jgi:hypothetical protein
LEAFLEELGVFAMAIFPTRYRLPVAYCTEIGRIVTRFAVLESRINKCGYVLLRLNPKQGRIAVRLGRAETSLTAIQDLLTLEKFTVRTDIPKLKRIFKQLEEARDRFSHGLWVKHSGTKLPVLQVTSGNFSESHGGQSIKARTHPQAVEVALSDLKKIVRAIDHSVAAVDRLGQEIDQALGYASGGKSARPKT